MIPDLTHKHDTTKYKVMTIVESYMELCVCFQGKTKTCNEYLRVFKSRVEMINAYGGAVNAHPAHTLQMVERSMPKREILGVEHGPGTLLLRKLGVVARNEYLACIFIK